MFNASIYGLCVMFCFFVLGCGCYQRNHFLQEKVKPFNYFGVVEVKFFDTFDRMTPKVKFHDGSIIYIRAYEMFDDLRPGDTIIKKAGSLKHILKRKGETKIFYPKCNGKEIK